MVHHHMHRADGPCSCTASRGCLWVPRLTMCSCAYCVCGVHRGCSSSMTCGAWQAPWSSSPSVTAAALRQRAAGFTTPRQASWAHCTCPPWTLLPRCPLSRRSSMVARSWCGKTSEGLAHMGMWSRLPGLIHACGVLGFQRYHKALPGARSCTLDAALRLLHHCKHLSCAAVPQPKVPS